MSGNGKCGSCSRRRRVARGPHLRGRASGAGPAATFIYSTVAPEGVISAHALTTDDKAALEELGTVTEMDDGSVSIELPSQMIMQDNASEFFCQGFGEDPECD